MKRGSGREIEGFRGRDSQGLRVEWALEEEEGVEERGRGKRVGGLRVGLGR